MFIDTFISTLNTEMKKDSNKKCHYFELAKAIINNNNLGVTKDKFGFIYESIKTINDSGECSN